MIIMTKCTLHTKYFNNFKRDENFPRIFVNCRQTMQTICQIRRARGEFGSTSLSSVGENAKAKTRRYLIAARRLLSLVIRDLQRNKSQPVIITFPAVARRDSYLRIGSPQEAHNLPEYNPEETRSTRVPLLLYTREKTLPPIYFLPSHARFKDVLTIDNGRNKVSK